MPDTGWISPGTAANVDRDGEENWITPNNALTSNDLDTTVLPKEAAYSDWLRVTNFTFGIPAGSTIVGIEVKIERAAADGYIRDSSLRLVKDGVVSGDDNASMTLWPATDGEAEYGGSADLWNSGYGYADVTDAGFGVQLSAYNTDAGAQHSAAVDHIAIKITYLDPYTHDVNEVPAANIGSVNDVPTNTINTINEV